MTAGRAIRPGLPGQKAKATSTSSGPVFGSVAWPVMIPPKFSPTTQINAATRKLKAKAGLTAAGKKIATPIVQNAAASSTGTSAPV